MGFFLIAKLISSDLFFLQLYFPHPFLLFPFYLEKTSVSNFSVIWLYQNENGSFSYFLHSLLSKVSILQNHLHRTGPTVSELNIPWKKTERFCLIHPFVLSILLYTFYWDISKIVAMHTRLFIFYSTWPKAIIIVGVCSHWLQKGCILFSHKLQLINYLEMKGKEIWKTMQLKGLSSSILKTQTPLIRIHHMRSSRNKTFPLIFVH